MVVPWPTVPWLCVEHPSCTELGRASGPCSPLAPLLALDCGMPDAAGEQRCNPAASSPVALGMYSCAQTLAKAKHPLNCLVCESIWDKESIRYNYPSTTQATCYAPVFGPVQFVSLQGLFISG